MFSAFVYIFFILLLEVGHGVVSFVADEGVLMGRTVVEKKETSSVYDCTVEDVE